MAEAPGAAATNHRIRASNQGSKRENDEFRFRRNRRSFSDMVFEFLDEEEANSGDDRTSSEPESYVSSDNDSYVVNGEEVVVEVDEEDDEERNNNNGGSAGDQEDKKFWENQHQLLQGTLRRTSSLETKIRNATKEAIKELENSGTVCSCGRPIASGCRSCLMTQLSTRLRNDGFNSAVCKSKWRSSPDIPSGDHTFVDVVAESSRSKKAGGEVRVIIELNLRGEFEMARASEDYNELVRRLPEVFVGKVERLNSVVKIMCWAAKKCMKDKKMHLGPWRKHRYMQAKWLAPCQRTAAATSASSSSGLLPLHPNGAADCLLRPPRVRASMLTVDLLEMMPNMHCKAVAVV